MLDNGYVKVYRSLLSWEWYDDINTKALFFHLLLTVNYEDKKWHGITVKRGQRVCSVLQLSQETKLSIKNVRTALEHLKRTNEVASEKMPQCGLFTVVNYNKYQSVANETANEGQSGGEAAANEGQQCNKAKKDNKAKNIIPPMPHFDQFWNIYPKKRSKGDAQKAWKALNPDSELAAIILQKVAAAKTCTDWVKSAGQYVPYPATWLRARGWEDIYSVEGYEERTDSL